MRFEISRQRQYPTPGWAARFAWRWLYTIRWDGDPGSADADTLAGARDCARSNARRLGVTAEIHETWREA